MVASACWNSAKRPPIRSRGNADPRVGHTKAQLAIDRLGADLHPSLLGELERIPRKVREALHDALAVAVGERKILGNGRDELQPFLHGERGERRSNRRHRVRHRVFAEDELHAPASIFERSSTS